MPTFSNKKEHNFSFSIMVKEASSPTRVSPRKRNLKYKSFAGMTTNKNGSPMKLGAFGGVYRGKQGMKNAPKSATRDR